MLSAYSMCDRHANDRPTVWVSRECTHLYHFRLHFLGFFKFLFTRFCLSVCICTVIMRRVAQEPPLPSFALFFFPFNHRRHAIGNAFGVDNKRSDLDIIMSERAEEGACFAK